MQEVNFVLDYSKLIRKDHIFKWRKLKVCSIFLFYRKLVDNCQFRAITSSFKFEHILFSIQDIESRTVIGAQSINRITQYSKNPTVHTILRADLNYMALVAGFGQIVNILLRVLDHFHR